MAEELRHVRFSLSDLIYAVQAFRGDTTPLSADQALTWYWNWASDRGWKLKMIANQIDSAKLASRIECGSQFEWAAEEYWNVVWSGEDIQASPDLVSEASVRDLSAAAKLVLSELFKRGWTVRSRINLGSKKPPEACLVRYNDQGPEHQIFLDDVIAVADEHGAAGTAVNLEDIVYDLEA